MRTTRHNEKGFSLSELMVVIAVFGLLVAISVPSIASHIRTARLNGTVHTLAADLRHARSLASSQRKTYAIAFEANSYSLVRVSPAATVLTRVLPQGITCTSPDTATFYAWGLTEPATFTVADYAHSNVLRLSATGNVSRD